MGLLQVPVINEEESTTTTTAMSAPVISPRFNGTDSSGLDRLPAGTSNSRAFPCPIIYDLKRKAALDATNGFDSHLQTSPAIDVPSAFQELRPDSRDTSCRSCPKIGSTIQMPAMRVVGFDSGFCSSAIGSDMMVADKMHSSLVIDSSDSSVEQHGPQARKRVLSPLANVLPEGQFHGDVLNIGSGDAKNQRTNSVRHLFSSGLHDSKKANTATLDSFDSPSWPALRYSIRSTKHHFSKFSCSTLTTFTDGPLLEGRGSLSCTEYLGAGTTENLSRVVIPPARLSHSPPLSLSPLGPKWIHRVNTAKAYGDLTGASKSDLLDSNGVERPNGENYSEYAGRIRMRDISGNPSSFHDGLDSMTPMKSSQRRYQNWGPESAPVSPHIRCIRSLSLPVRRSLVGSFEESLLSGRYSCGKDNQVHLVFFRKKKGTPCFQYS
jgi:hypothetical protein